MSEKICHVRETAARLRHRRPVRRAATLLAATFASVLVLAGAAFALSPMAAGHARSRLQTSARPPAAKIADSTRYSRLAWSAGESLPATASAASGTSAPLTLTQAERGACPPAAAACVDLKAHLTWLQSGGTVAYGPVRMEPGPPGTPHATPAGTFQVDWKAGPDFISNEYNEPMPWATFFGTDGIAFHGGSLTQPSHGCVHLTLPVARYFHDHLPLGAEVVVF